MFLTKPHLFTQKVFITPQELYEFVFMMDGYTFLGLQNLRYHSIP